MTDIGLRILLQAQDQASRVISGLGSQLLKAAGDAGPLLAAGFAIGAGVIAVGVAATHMAADFRQAMLSNVAHAGLAKNQVNAVSDAILNMAPIVGKSPTLLAEAMYPILSAFSGITNQGAKAALSLTTLKNSAETVAGSTTKVEAVAQAAVGTFNALGLATNNVNTNTKRMNDLFDVMDLTVQLGNMKWEQYKNVVSKVAVAIQGTGISFNESQAALATMTNEGFSAQRASTYLINTFNTLGIKTNALAAHAKKLGIDFNQAKYGPMSLADKIEYLNKITDGNKQKLLALMGNNATALKTFNALSVGIDAYKSNLNSLNHAHGALKSSFDTASQGFNFAVQRVRAFIDVLLIKIGTALLPILTQLVNMIIPAATWFITMAQAVSKNQLAMDAIKSVLVGVAVVIGTLLISAFIGWATAAWAAAVATLAATWPILLIGAIVAAVVFGIIQAVRHWGAIIAWLKGLWTAFSSWFGGIMSAIGTFFHNIWTGIQNFFRAAWNVIVNIAKVAGLLLIAVILGPAGIILALIISHWNQITSFLRNAWNTITSDVRAAWNWITSVVSRGVSTVVSFFASLPGKAIGAVQSLAGKLLSFFSGIASNAVGWGLNIIKNLAGGIISGISGALGGALSSIGTFIHDHLPHSPAKRGPLRDLARQGSLIPVQIAEGMLRGQGALQVALNKTFTLSAPVTTSGSRSLTPAGGQVINIGPVYVNAGVGGSTPSQLADQLLDQLSRKLRQSGNLITWTSGGRA